MRLDGKVALITGGGTGIGSAVAARFVSEGAKVCIVGRRKEMLDKVVGSLPAGMATATPGDVSKREDVARIVEMTVAFGGRLDILVNNAGMDQEPANVVDIDPDVWQRVIDVNLTGPMLLMKASIPHMLKTGAGSIVNIASLAGIRCIPNMPSYCASKGGLIMLTQQAALDFGPRNIRCNVICPGAVRTEMIEGAMGHFTEKLKTDVDGVLARFQKDVPLRRVSAPREIAALCAYLASDDSSFVTGTVIPADGGAAIVDVSGAVISAIVEG
jgi:meso-butanediol dehydrogenase / (S,S)-butanediol dehydrogenase / diacetyl reductase